MTDHLRARAATLALLACTLTPLTTQAQMTKAEVASFLDARQEQLTETPETPRGGGRTVDETRRSRAPPRVFTPKHGHLPLRETRQVLEGREGRRR